MAEHRPTTKASEHEGVSVTLTEENYPRCLMAQTRGDALDACMNIAQFLRTAVSSMFAVARDDGLPKDDEMDSVMLGYECCCDLLLDHLDMIADASPMPQLNDLEARRG